MLNLASLSLPDFPDLELAEALYGISTSRDPSLADLDTAIGNAFRARADVRMSRGEFHLALADYGRA